MSMRLFGKIFSVSFRHFHRTKFSKSFFFFNSTEVFCAGLRRFIFKEDLDTLEEAKKRYRWMTILHYLMMTVIFTILAFIMYKILSFYGFIESGTEIITDLKSFVF
ncbi:CLUMA_CG019524, isoform A [Clunio marinus]|uniref:CLUMA_CG019524, isoform A n=1 Tax=Clunio marinus TaxID=568069 RepID=A0A1J1J302_9DIPT|nr:CLUMA_CG019524, isoform A [Clunio marinus]